MEKRNVPQTRQNFVISRCLQRTVKNVQRFITHVHSYCSETFCVRNKCFRVCVAWKNNIQFVFRAFKRPRDIMSKNVTSFARAFKLPIISRMRYISLTCASALSFSASTASNKSSVSLSLLTIPSTSDPTKVDQLVRVRCVWLLHAMGQLTHDLVLSTQMRIQECTVQYTSKVGVVSFTFYLDNTGISSISATLESSLNSFGGRGAQAPFPNSGW